MRHGSKITSLALGLGIVLLAGCGGGGGGTPATPAASTRSFSVSQYTPGTAFTVTVQTTPDTDTEYWAIEDDPPAGWTVGAISDGGVFDSVTGKVKWGPFADNTARTLTYMVTPPDSALGAEVFEGDISLDGKDADTEGSASISN